MQIPGLAPGPVSKGPVVFGSPGWDRTTDALINSQLQLPLCYWGINLIVLMRLELNYVVVCSLSQKDF